MRKSHRSKSQLKISRNVIPLILVFVLLIGALPIGNAYASDSFPVPELPENSENENNNPLLDGTGGQDITRAGTDTPTSVDESAGTDASMDESAGTDTSIEESAPAEAPVPVGASADAAWVVSYNITDAQGNPKTSYAKGDQVKAVLTFTKPVEVTSLTAEFLEQEVILYIQKDFFDVSDGNLGGMNQVIGGGTIPMLVDNCLSSPGELVTLGNEQSYYPYTIKFNSSAEAVAAYANEGLAYASFTLNFVITMELTDPGMYEPIAVETEDDLSFAELPGPPDEDGDPALSKMVQFCYRSFDNGATYKLNNSYTTGTLKPMKGDILVFEIEIKNPFDAIVYVDKVVDNLGKGYLIYDPDNPWPAPATDAARTQGEVLYNAATLATWNWVASTQDYNQYEHVFDPTQHIYKNGKITLHMVVYVNEDPAFSGSTLLNERLNNDVTVCHGETPYDGTAKFKPAYTKDFDPALQTNITTFARDTKMQIASSTGISYNDGTDRIDPHEYDVAANPGPVPQVQQGGDYAKVTYTIFNQGEKAINNIKVAAYIPKGFEVVSGDDPVMGDFADNQNSQWTKGDSIGDGYGQWCDLERYYTTVTLASPLAMNNNTKITIYLRVIGEKADWEESKRNYYVGGEIVSFQDELGNPPKDVDAVNDDHPYNDLWLTTDGTGDGKATTVDSSLKEKHNQTGGNSGYNAEKTVKNVNIKYYPGNDEDDFDFDFVVFDSYEPNTGTGDGMLTKTRLSAVDAESFLRSCYSKVAKYDSITTHYYLKNLIPLPDTGEVSTINNYVVYELKVNWDGTADTLGSKLVDSLPPGLKLLTYKSSADSLATYTAIKIEKIVGNPREPDGSINHSRYSTEEIIYYDNNSDNGIKGGHTYYMGQPTQQLFGVNATKTEDGRELTVKFEPPTGTSKIQADTRGAYRITFAAVIEYDQIQFKEVVKNQAVYTRDGGSYPAEEADVLYWNFDADSAYVKKYVQGGEDWLAYPNPAVGDIDSEGNLSVDYKIRLRSVGSSSIVNAGALKATDQLPSNAVLVPASLRVEGFKDAGDSSVVKKFDDKGELIDPVPIVSDEITVKATLSDQTLTISNFAATPVNQLYNVYFHVDYSNVHYGDAVLNDAGTRVYTMIPLKFVIRKQDAVSKESLEGYEFRAYELDIEGKPDTSRPVKDAEGEDIVLNDESSEFSFMPADHTPFNHESKEWQFALVETQAPEGYSQNENAWCKVTVQSKDDGSLSVKEISDPDSKFVLTSGKLEEAIVTVSNTADETPESSLTIIKADNSAQPKTLAGAIFSLENKVYFTDPSTVPDGVPTDNDDGGSFYWEMMDTGEDKISEGNGIVNFTGLLYGIYRITETKAPTGYVLLKEPIIVTIDEDGASYVIGNEESISIPADAEDGSYKLMVINNPTYILPKTGGMGTGVIYMVGTGIVLFAFFMLYIYNLNLKEKNARGGGSLVVQVKDSTI